MLFINFRYFLLFRRDNEEEGRKGVRREREGRKEGRKGRRSGTESKGKYLWERDM
jgi:hypothetical protein